MQSPCPIHGLTPPPSVRGEARRRSQDAAMEITKEESGLPIRGDRADTVQTETSSLELVQGFSVGRETATEIRESSASIDGDVSQTGDFAERIHTGFWTDSGAKLPRPQFTKRHGIKPPEVPGYEILGELGRGGMGVVYQARQVRLNRLVALKMILAGDHASRDALRRLVAEAETMARVKHPNIVQIHSIGDCGGWPYIELEFIEGGSLAARLDGTQWSPRSAARLLESLARAVSEAHRVGIIHRDLKPANILMTANGEPKISDFGLAKSIESGARLTQTESILGSPTYMAPEQAAGHAKDVGPAADVYALGACLYELVTGQPPFVAPTILATLDLVKNSEPVAPRKYQPHLPRDLETICLKCLEKEPHKRYSSAEALADDLAAFLNDETIRVRRPRPWERAIRWAKRKPTAAALIAVCVLTLFASCGFWAWRRAEVANLARITQRRDAAIRNQAVRFLSLGQDAVKERDWETAHAQLSSAKALVGSQPRLADMRATVERLLDLCARSISERKARASARDHFARFIQLYDEAVFCQAEFTGMDADANLRAARAAAREGLAQFVVNRGESGGLELNPKQFTAQEIQKITDDYYELSLLLAEAESQPIKGEDPVTQARVGLQVLGAAARLRRLSPTFHVRRATYLERAGDAAAAHRERKLAETAAPTDQSPVDDFLTGQLAYRKNDLKGASDALKRALSRQPDHFWAQYLLAVCHLRAHRPAEAQAALIACQSRRPRFVWSYLLKGFAEGEMGEFDLAEADFRVATELGLSDQERYVMLVNRGVMRLKRGSKQEAVEDLSAAISLKPEHFQAYINLSQAYQSLNEAETALKTLERAIALAPDQAVLFRARSQIHQSSSRHDAALMDLDRAIELSKPDDPNLATDYLTSALLLQQEGRAREALEACDRAIEHAPDRSDAHRLRGVVLVGLKRYDEAISSFDICMKRGKVSQAIYEVRGLARACSGSYERAVAEYTMALNLGRGSSSLYTNRGWAYLLGGAPAPALRDFDEALRLEPSNSHAMSGRAQANVQLRKPLEAVADARGAVRLNPRDARQSYNAARVLCQAVVCLENDPRRSRAQWEECIRFRSEALEYLSRAKEQQPPGERARFWNEVVRTDPALEPVRRARKFLELDAGIARLDRPSTPKQVNDDGVFSLPAGLGARP